MANGMYEFGTSNPYIFGHLYWESTSNGSVANSTFMTIRVCFFRTNGYTTYGTINTSVQCDNGVQSENGYSISFSTSEVVAYVKNFNIPHNSDGTKALYIRCCGDCDAGFSFDANWSFWLENIPRYASYTQWKVTSVGLTSASFYWNTDSAVKRLLYKINGGEWQSDKNDQSFTLSNFNPETNYTIQISVQRSDSNLWTESSVLTFTTLPIVKLATNSFNVNIGGNVTLNFINKDNNASQLQFFTAPASGGSWTHRQDVSIPAGTASYTWNTSSLANAMYAEAPNTNTMRILVYCRYDSTRLTECQGTGIVTNSNPTFSDFTFSNTDTSVTSIVGNNMLTYIGNLRITIPESNKAVPKNSARMSYYNLAISKNGTIIASKKANYSTTNLNIDVGTFNTSGTYTLMIDAVDSRGNASSVVQKQIVFYPYHSPTPTINLRRYGGFEKEIQLSLSALISRVVIDSADKNSIQYIKYRYCETGSSFPATYENILNYSSTVIDQNDNKITYSRESADDYFIKDLDRAKSYEFEFVFKDNCKETVTRISLLQGKPISTILDNNKMLVNVTPTEDIITDNKADLFVGNDIKIGSQYVMEKMDMLGVWQASNTKVISDALLVDVSKPYSDVNVGRYGVINYAGNPIITSHLPGTSSIAGFREVKYWSRNAIVVYVYEWAPQYGRVWYNMYNGTTWRGWSNNWLDAHPVNDTVFYMDHTNPSDMSKLGGGTWQLTSQGRMPVGRDTTQSEFNTLNDGGGSKTNTHEHWTANSFDGSTGFMGEATYLGLRTRTLNGNRTFWNAANSNGGMRQDSTYKESINILPPYQVFNIWRRIA